MVVLSLSVSGVHTEVIVKILKAPVRTSNHPGREARTFLWLHGTVCLSCILMARWREELLCRKGQLLSLWFESQQPDSCGPFTSSLGNLSSVVHTWIGKKTQTTYLLIWDGKILLENEIWRAE